jgi:5-(carboxyamino)imidazole ribonucleotide synthase
MYSSSFPYIKIGVLGGGQLGKMLCQAASPWNLQIHILDPDENCSSKFICSSFTKGHFNDYNAVYNFGKDKDIITVEIEHVNTEALLQLEKDGKKIHPSPSALNVIKDKGLQKLHYQKHNIPTSAFRLYENKKEVLAAINKQEISIPFVLKTRTAGYDGKGVVVVKNINTLDNIPDAACVIEELVEIEKEISVIAAANENGEIKCFPAVEMKFNPVANLVEYLFCPAQISESVSKQAEGLAVSVIKSYNLCGLLAVEMFLDKSGNILVNEVAPRPHNSGHHTIESCYTPLGSTKMKSASAMVNLLGEPGYEGKAKYIGIEKCLSLEGVKIHVYGKEQTKPYRKMGHVTVLADTLSEAEEKAKFVKETLKVTA